MARLRYGAKRELSPEHNQALVEINKIVRSLGFSQAELDEAKRELASYMPQSVFLDKYGNDDGWAKLYAIFAPQIVHDYYKEAKRGGEKAQSPRQRRLVFEEFGGEFDDYVNSVFMGWHDGSERFRGGVRSVAVPDIKANPNKYIYDPRRSGTKKSICPHCKVSFWEYTAGNTDPEYQHIVDPETNVKKPLREWREDPNEAPEHVRFNPSTGERVEKGGYSYCGGKHVVHDVTSDLGEIDIELAERLSGLPWDTLAETDRVRAIEAPTGEGSDTELRYILVDEYLEEVEVELRKTGGAAYKNFSADWIYEDNGQLYRECRHPIDLKSPASVIYDRIAKYTYLATGAGKGEQAQKIKAYKCPNCPGQFLDKERVTEEIENQQPIYLVRCDDCGHPFDIRDLDPETDISEMSYLPPQISLYSADPKTEGEATHLVDTLGDPRSGVSELAVQVMEVIDMFEEEIEAAARSTNIRGAEKATDIFLDWVLNGLNYREITEKYFGGIYKLHYTECLDCGYTMEEKANPEPQYRERYDAGLPHNMTACPLRHSHPNHKVELAPKSAPTQHKQKVEEEANPFAGMMSSVTTEGYNDPQEVTEVDDSAGANLIEDEEQKRKHLGTNLLYHGQAPQGSDQLGITYKIVDMERGISERLSPDDPQAYKGKEGVITPYIYAPTQRLLKTIIDTLQKSPRLQAKHEQAVEVLTEWGQSMLEASERTAKTFKGFCKT